MSVTGGGSDGVQPITRLLRPRSVAIIGASPTPGALGASVLSNLERLQFRGDIHLINPKRDEIGGRRCLKSADELPEGVDVAVLAIPRAAVLDTIRALTRRRVGAAVIFSAGFAEGGEEGLREQQEIARLAREHDMVIEGPNCLGLVNHVDGVALTFVETPAVSLGQRPAIGIVSQSGAMAAVVGVVLAARELGVSYSVSTGNEAASGVEDYLEFMLEDTQTRAIGLIVELFRQPTRLLALARRARTVGKTLVLLHPGRSSAARASAATHTGALAGDYALMRAKVEREGVVVADTLEEFGDILEIVLRCPAMPATGSAVVAESGAFKALTLDLCEQIALPLPTLTDQNAPELREAMPPFVPVSNPLDLTAQGLVDPDMYRRTLTALIHDERIGSVCVGLIQTDAVTSNIKFPPLLSALRAQPHPKPVVIAGLDEGAAVPVQYIQELRALGVPYFPSAERALRALARLREAAARDLRVAPSSSRNWPTTLPSGVIAEHRSKTILGELGVPFPPARLVQTLAQAQQVAAELGYPIVLKAQSAQLPHKTEAGGVVLQLASAEEVAAGWTRLHENIVRHRPDLTLDGVLVEKMGARGIELIVGARRDPAWGPLILAGFGGVQAEILKDVRLLAPDLPLAAIESELLQLKSAALLRGFRGAPALDVQAVAQLVALLGALLLAVPAIREIDLNPVIVHPQGQGIMALDALMVVD